MQIITETQFFDMYGLSLIPPGADPEADKLQEKVVSTIRDNYLKYLERIVREEAALQSKRPGVEKSPLRLLARYFFTPGMWDPYYGGEPWGKIATALCELREAPDMLVARKVIDHIHDLEHNTATVMNRCMDSYTFKKWLDFKQTATPQQLAQKCSPAVRKLIQAHVVAGVESEHVKKHVDVPAFSDLQKWYITRILKERIPEYNPVDVGILTCIKEWLDGEIGVPKFNLQELKRVRIMMPILFGKPDTEQDDIEELNLGRYQLIDYFESL